MLPAKADVVVIGGGVIGSSIAYYLSKRKIPVVLLERGAIGSGTSSACDGLIFLQTKKPGTHLKLAMESGRLYETLSEELDFNIEHRNCGGMILIESEPELQAMRRIVEAQKDAGLDVSLIERSPAIAMAPCLSQDFIAATYSPRDAQVNPICLVRAFIKAATRLGAKIFSQTEVTDIGLTSHGVRSVTTPRGKIETSVIVNAAGAYAPHIGRMTGIDVPIIPRRGQLLLTEAVKPILSHCLISATYIAAKYSPDVALHSEIALSIEQTANGNFLLGSTREFVGYDRRTTPDGIRGIANYGAKILPLLKELRAIRSFAGLRPYTPDGLPILGKVECREGFIMAAGHEGDGIALSPITGQLTAQIISEGSTDFDLSDYRLERFSEEAPCFCTGLLQRKKPV
jgi:glycine/D-amino acid oxidase-like deaminating enzyme